MKEKLQDEMGIMQVRVLQALKVKADEIYTYVNKKADEVRILRVSIYEQNQTFTETKNEFDRTV